ncbi:MAG: flagellar biosynthesis protein FlhF [Lachnospiraceae bacterium]|nr:flagellar biosynthesis protein FlhF [Lachnospiraceae bacterium]
MIIKKFTGKTEEEAVEAAKKELGEGIVIMNVKNVKKRGFFSIFKRQQKEVTVALEEEELQKSRREKQEKQQEGELRSVVEAVSQIARASEQERQKNEGRQLEADMFSSPAPTPARASRAAAAYESAPGRGTQTMYDLRREARESEQRETMTGSRSRSQREAEPEYDKRLESLQEFLEKQIAAPINQAAAMTEYENPGGAEDSNLAFFRLLYQMMIENEVDEEYAVALIDDLAANVKPNSPLDHLLATVYQRLVLKLGEAETISPASKGPKVIFFVGPTGVGKTTTIAKLASSFRVEQKKRIALLTADTYRIAAAEQLRTYANILEVPFRIIYTPAELRSAVRELESCDYILVDTAGHSPHNASQKDGMADLLGALDFSVEKEVYLVVSATTKYKDLCMIADSYRDMTAYSLIFTKVDETTTLGSILNLRLYTGAPLAYITIGQNVPDDIEIFNAQETVKMLLSGQMDASMQ